MSFHNKRDAFGRFATAAKKVVGKVAKAVGKIKVAADQSEEQAYALAHQQTSFEVYYIRQKDLNGEGGVKSNKNNPSKRRFRNESEARHHATRFVESQKHLGYYVSQVNKRPTAWVNEATGLTNPEL